MTRQDSAGFDPTDRRDVARGVAFTVLGRIAGTVNGLFMFVAAWMYGATPFGLFAITYALTELLGRFLYSGFGDAAVYFAARRGAARDLPGVHRALATCLGIPMGLSLALVAAVHLSAPLIYEHFWAQEHDPVLVPLLRAMVWVFPLMVLVRIPVEAVKAKMDMKWAALVIETWRPLANFVLALVGWLLGFGVWGLVVAHVGGVLLSVPLAWYGYSRHFRIRDTFDRLFKIAPEREVVAFALPQSANMLLTYGLTRVDVLMLSVWVPADLVGVYLRLSLLTVSIRVAKTSFSGVFAPLVSKYKELGNQEGLVTALHSVSRWTSLAGVGLTAPLLAFYPDIILGPGRPWEHSQWLPWLLLIGPLVSCYFGLAGNLLLMTGHSRLLLLNSIVSMVLNILLNLLLIPRLGLVGAAVATALSGGAMSSLQVWEVRHYEQVRYRLSEYAKPTTAAALLLAFVAWANASSGYGLLFQFGVVVGISLKVVLVLLAVAAAAVIVLGWPGPNPEREWLAARWAARRQARGAQP